MTKEPRPDPGKEPADGIVWMPLNEQSAIMEAPDLQYLNTGSPEEKTVAERLHRDGLQDTPEDDKGE